MISSERCRNKWKNSTAGSRMDAELAKKQARTEKAKKKREEREQKLREQAEALEDDLRAQFILTGKIPASEYRKTPHWKKMREEVIAFYEGCHICQGTTVYKDQWVVWRKDLDIFFQDDPEDHLKVCHECSTHFRSS